MKFLYPFVCQFVAFDGDPSGDPGGDPGQKPPSGKTYTEEEFNTHSANLRRKYESRETELKTTQRQLAEQLELLKTSKGVSDEERVEYDKRIKQLEDSFLTEKEKIERRTNTQKTEYETQIQKLSAEREKYVTNYKNEVVNNQIMSSASQHKAVDPEQIAAILKPMITWQDVLVDGEPNGEVRPVVKFNDTDKDGKPVVMDYTVEEAVKRMREIPRWHNQFEDTLKGGLGGRANVGKGTGQVDIARIAKENPAEYRRLRKERPDLIYGQ